ncbi:MAG: TlpA disulfide reductase family protein [Gammaproteobacteria bacterium]|nr:TlpA disulfide reductase family protein [Gammaproteobacteria bacterium]
MKKIHTIITVCLMLLTLTQAQAKPDLSLHTLQGQTIPLQSLKGKWVMIHYWASWCDICVNEIDTFNRFYKKHQEQVALFAVNMDEVSQSEQQHLSEQYHLQFPSLLQGHTPPFDGKELTVVPATLVYSPEGSFQSVYYGMQTLTQLRTIIGLTHQSKSTNKAKTDIL